MACFDRMGAAELAAGVAAGAFSAAEVAAAALDATEQRDGGVRAFLHVTPELALDAAARVDAARAAGEPLPPLAGVPFAIKDNMNLMGTRTTCASRMLETFESPFTATCVQRMLDAGCVPIGKVNMDEFAFGSTTESSAFHPTHNPWDFGRVPGGSSGGSAAAVAAGMVPLALGSDTGGSIRQPAALCGVVGMKPSYGMVSRYGVVAFGSSLDQVGPLGRSVADVALALDALTAPGRDPYDSTSVEAPGRVAAGLDAGVAGARVGVIPAFMDAPGLDDDMKEAMQLAARVLQDQGAELVEIELSHLDAAIAAYYVIGPAEAFSNLARFDGVRYGHQEPGCSSLSEQTARSRARGFGPEAMRRQMLGAYLLSSGVYDKYYYAAQKARTLITADYERAFRHVDVILMPASPTVAVRHGELSDPTRMYLSDLFTISINIAGNGGVTVPLGLGETSKLPVAAQLVGKPFGDGGLLVAARALERGFEELTGEPGCRVAPACAGKGGELA